MPTAVCGEVISKVVELITWNMGFKNTYTFGDGVFLAALVVFIVELFIWGDTLLADAGGWMEAETFLDYCNLEYGMCLAKYRG